MVGLVCNSHIRTALIDRGGEARCTLSEHLVCEEDAQFLGQCQVIRHILPVLLRVEDGAGEGSLGQDAGIQFAVVAVELVVVPIHIKGLVLNGVRLLAPLASRLQETLAILRDETEGFIVPRVCHTKRPRREQCADLRSPRLFSRLCTRRCGGRYVLCCRRSRRKRNGEQRGASCEG